MRNMNIKSIQQWFSRAGELVNEFYNAPYRSAIARAKRDEDDLFMMLVLCWSAFMIGINAWEWNTHPLIISGAVSLRL